MELSKEDMFSESQQTAASATASTNVLDFHKHGDDVLNMLYWSVLVTAATNGSALTIAWETSDTEAFSSATTLWTKTVAATGLTLGAEPVKNEALPKGLKRYNRLKYTGEASKTAYPKVTAFIHAGRDEGTPYRG